eukprot:m.12411 g.12411  ORF g.12411 m.12411 type:complete len:57 (-) comp7204_c0_seq1:76-246(-)
MPFFAAPLQEEFAAVNWWISRIEVIYSGQRAWPLPTDPQELPLVQEHIVNMLQYPP